MTERPKPPAKKETSPQEFRFPLVRESKAQKQKMLVARMLPPPVTTLSPAPKNLFTNTSPAPVDIVTEGAG
jgi:hypothetical protein